MSALNKTQKDNATSTMRKLLIENEKSCTEIINIALSELYRMSFEHTTEEKTERLEEYQAIMDKVLVEA